MVLELARQISKNSVASSLCNQDMFPSSTLTGFEQPKTVPSYWYAEPLPVFNHNVLTCMLLQYVLYLLLCAWWFIWHFICRCKCACEEFLVHYSCPTFFPAMQCSLVSVISLSSLSNYVNAYNTHEYAPYHVLALPKLFYNISTLLIIKEHNGIPFTTIFGNSLRSASILKCSKF